MPVRKIEVKARVPKANANLVDHLADELKSKLESGQPVVYVQEFPTGNLRVSVIWDAWARLSLEERTEIILRAYEKAEGRLYRDRIALASGLTVPEAYSGGMLPFQIITALRKSDPVTPEQCREAMIAEGASTLWEQPQLRFASEEEAEAAKLRLIERLPRSDDVWVITQELGKVADWSEN